MVWAAANQFIHTVRTMLSPAALSAIQPVGHIPETPLSRSHIGALIRLIYTISLRLYRRLRSFSHRFFLVLHRPGDGFVQGVFQGGHGLDEHGPVLRGEVGKLQVTDFICHHGDAVDDGLRPGTLPRRRSSGISGLLSGCFGLLIPVFLELGQHAPLLLLPGDHDENVLRNGLVLAAFVPDLLGKPVEEQFLLSCER